MEFYNATNLNRKSGYLGRKWFISNAFPEGRNRTHFRVALPISKWRDGFPVEFPRILRFTP